MNENNKKVESTGASCEPDHRNAKVANRRKKCGPFQMVLLETFRDQLVRHKAWIEQLQHNTELAEKWSGIQNAEMEKMIDALIVFMLSPSFPSVWLYESIDEMRRFSSGQLLRQRGKG